MRGGRFCWILSDDRTPVQVDMLMWAEWVSVSPDRCVVARTSIKHTTLEVSTVFVGVDMRWHHRKATRPMLFETMVFGGPDSMVRRYATWAEAEAGHLATLKELGQ